MTSWVVRYWYDEDTGWMTTYPKDEAHARQVFADRSERGRVVRLVKVETVVTETIVEQNNPPAREEGE